MLISIDQNGGVLVIFSLGIQILLMIAAVQIFLQTGRQQVDAARCAARLVDSLEIVQDCGRAHAFRKNLEVTVSQLRRHGHHIDEHRLAEHREWIRRRLDEECRNLQGRVELYEQDGGAGAHSNWAFRYLTSHSIGDDIYASFNRGHGSDRDLGACAL